MSSIAVITIYTDSIAVGFADSQLHPWAEDRSAEENRGEWEIGCMHRLGKDTVIRVRRYQIVISCHEREPGYLYQHIIAPDIYCKWRSSLDKHDASEWNYLQGFSFMRELFARQGFNLFFSMHDGGQLMRRCNDDSEMMEIFRRK